MTAYELMIKTNHHLIRGGQLTDRQKANIAGQLLSARSTAEQAKRFYTGVRFPGNTDDGGRRMYPVYYIPPYSDGKKLKTVFFQTPKTHILSANMYELEILRLLYLLIPDNEAVKLMTGETLKRLKTTCFGNADDGVGECFDASLIVLRYLAAVAPQEKKWIQERIDNYNRHALEKKRTGMLYWYYWLCLSEIPTELAIPEILKEKDRVLPQLHRSSVMNSEQDRALHPVLVCAIRNLMARLPEYEYIKDREPYINDKDGRLYFNMAL